MYRGRLPRTAAFYLQASIMVSFLAGSSAPTPLYAHYQAEWGFSSITTTVVFGSYALAVLAALLTVGSLSDHVGRRPVLLIATVVQAATMMVFAFAGGVPTLLAARVVQGLATGAAAGAIGAGLLDLHRDRGTVANAVAPVLGTATGAIGSGLLVQYLPFPARLVYLVLLATFVLQAVGVALMPETAAARPGALASLRLHFGLPAAARGPLLIAVPALVAVWALAGFYGSLGPALVDGIVGSDSAVLGGLALFVLAASAGASVLVLRTCAARRLMTIGASALVLGVGITVVAVSATSTAGFFLGTAVSGVGFGAGFQGAIHSVVPLAEPHERAGVLSVVYVVSYLALGLPAVIGGFLAVYAGGVRTTAQEYGGAIMALAVAALVGSAVRSRADRIGGRGRLAVCETAQVPEIR
ncbi:MAG TPA: MFS transporter [Mycobacteriales bacterium]|jgi:predicted MFS family arabinose efflux permease|nr:MFS transporter [Mycobacteriales bacterium]